jgi:5-methylcytosine-specific restriction endonuclease McrA
MAFPQSVKDAAKKRSGGRCECTRVRHTNDASHSGRCPKSGVEYHHKVSVKAGGADTLANCEHLCRACHQGTESYGG